MKHIFKKKQHHQPNRSNENLNQSSSFSSDSRTNTTPSSVSINNNSNHSNTPNNSSSGVDTDNRLRQRQNNQLQQKDYFSSEEEYQVQLALALSVSSSTAQDSANVGKEADLLSRRYWTSGLLDYDERVVDGFYDLYPVSADPAVRGTLPSLEDLENGIVGSDYVVVTVNRKLDPALEELIQVAQCIVLDCSTSGVTLLVQRLAELVTDHMGGSVHDANIILAKWMDICMELRTSLHTSVLPIGSLRVGLLRYRALLFKVLSYNVGIPCKLVKGSHYTGVEDDAVSIIKLQDNSEFLVDLMGAPGTLIPANLGTKGSLKSSNPQASMLANQTTTNARITSSQYGQNIENGHNLDSGSTSRMDARTIDEVGPSRLNGKVSIGNMLNLKSLATESPLCEGGQQSISPVDGVRKNVNVIPDTSKNAEDPKKIFADLNPFQIKGSSKSAVQNDFGNQVGEVQFPRKNNAGSQLPSPLMWKNRHAWNEAPKEDKNKLMQGLSVSNNEGSNCGKAASAVSQNSMVQLSTSKVTLESFNNPGENSSSRMFNINSEKSEPSQFHVPVKDTHHREDLDIMKHEDSKSESECHTNNNRLLDKQNLHDRLNGSNIRLKESVGASCSIDSGANYDNTVIDDVGECEILWEDLAIGERIGLGSYGEVYRADWNGTEVAVKRFLDQDFSGAALDEFKREVRIMRRLRHPNVVRFMGAVTRPPNLSIVSEFMPRESLYRIIHRPHCHIDESTRIKMALDVAKGMNCLHTSTPTIVHRDLKSPNLLVDNDWNIKVCDFGLSRLKHSTFLSSKSTAGTPEWMAPEVLRNEPSSEKCDVYSFGVILWELATLKLPWSDMNPMQVVGAVGFQNRRLDIPKEVDPMVARIILECWQTDPSSRPSFAQLCVVLKPLQRLIVPTTQMDQPATASLISVNSEP